MSNGRCSVRVVELSAREQGGSISAAAAPRSSAAWGASAAGACTHPSFTSDSVTCRLCVARLWPVGTESVTTIFLVQLRAQRRSALLSHAANAWQVHGLQGAC
jgi:hypothetical protein